MPLPILLFIAIISVLILRLTFPESSATFDAVLGVLYVVMLIVMVSGMSGMLRRQSKQKLWNDLILWAAIFLFITLSYNLFSRGTP